MLVPSGWEPDELVEERRWTSCNVNAAPSRFLSCIEGTMLAGMSEDTVNSAGGGCRLSKSLCCDL